MIGAPRVRKGPPYHRVSFATDKENHLAVQQFQRNYARGSTHEEEGGLQSRRDTGDHYSVHASNEKKKLAERHLV